MDVIFDCSKSLFVREVFPLCHSRFHFSATEIFFGTKIDFELFDYADKKICETGACRETNERNLPEIKSQFLFPLSREEEDNFPERDGAS